MKYEEIVAKVREALNNKDISEYKKHLAIQFNITGEGGGAFYIEFNNGNINVEPFEYYDRDAIVTISADNLFAILDGSLDTTAGYVDHYFDVTNLGVINEFKNVITEAKIIETPTVTEVVETVPVTVETAEVENVKEKEEEVSTKADTEVDTENVIDIQPVIEDVPKDKQLELVEEPTKNTSAKTKSTTKSKTTTKKTTSSTKKKTNKSKK